MNQEDRLKAITNYYKASSALMEIGTIEYVPEELKQLAINASAATVKIIDYINTHKIWSCYDCRWSTDKCKNKDSNQYNKFLQNIDKCNLTGEVDNSLGRSWRNLGENID